MSKFEPKQGEGLDDTDSIDKPRYVLDYMGWDGLTELACQLCLEVARLEERITTLESK